ncbi:MAG TPA: DUF6178 family protein [Vicinamibacterales bacterium]|nr:DUF6178 family protein [Vicinamibacterales bacterium]
MENDRQLLARLVDAHDVASIVPRLQPEILHRVIQTCGLEDCSELVALATPEQLTRILDVDIWRSGGSGDEELDVNRFGVWLEVLMECGAPVAAQKLLGLDIDLIIAGLARHTAVFDGAAVSSYITLDGEQVAGRVFEQPTCKIGGYVIEARRASAWDAIVRLLAFLDSEHPQYFGRLMRGCVRLSDGSREADGFHDLLEDREQDLFDLAGEREARRDKQGFVSPAQARAFLQTARQLDIADDQPAVSAVARAYFRTAAAPLEEDDDSAREPEVAPPESDSAAGGVVDVLREAGLLMEQPRALLPPADGESARLMSITTFLESHVVSAEEAAFLANTLIAGCSLRGRAFTPREASDAVIAICNLGLENWPERWREHGLLDAFQVGWMILHRDICVFVAKRLIGIIADIRCQDRDIQFQLRALRRELIRHGRDGAPWRARNALDVMMMLDAPAWAALVGLIDECPVMHAALDPAGRSVRSIPADAFQFISENSQIAIVREFVERLPSMLTG